MNLPPKEGSLAAAAAIAGIPAITERRISGWPHGTWMRLAWLVTSTLLLAGCAGDDAFPGDYLASAHPTPDGLRLIDEEDDSPMWRSMRDAAGMTSNPGKVDLSRLQDQVDAGNATLLEAWAAVYEQQGAPDEDSDGPQLLVSYAMRFSDGAEALQWIADMGCEAFGDEVRIAIDGSHASMLLALGDSDVTTDGAAQLHARIIASTGATDPCGDED